jgi:hypothetical protein
MACRRRCLALHGTNTVKMVSSGAVFTLAVAFKLLAMHCWLVNGIGYCKVMCFQGLFMRSQRGALLLDSQPCLSQYRVPVV